MTIPTCRVCGHQCEPDAEVMYWLHPLPGRVQDRPVGICSPECQQALDDDKEPRQIPRVTRS